jgi:hypothetical protein
MANVDSLAGKPEWPRAWNGGPAEPKGAPAFSVAFDVRTSNEANGSTQRWAKVQRRASARDATTLALSLALVEHPLPVRGPWCVRLTRVSPSRLDDDAVPLALKTIRDTLAAALGVDDGSPEVAFAYAQAKGKPMGVRVEVWGPSSLPAVAGSAAATPLST